MRDRDEPSASGGPLDTEIANLGPDSIDGRLIHGRLMAKMFGREVDPPRLGRFELRERIGQGSMGVVYRAWDPQLERPVAVKVVDTMAIDAGLRERALQEARSVAKLAHPHVITVFEAGLMGRRVWIAMELVEGTTLHEWLEQAPRPDDSTILQHWIAVGRGLLAAHRVGLVHRDVKPSNVLIGHDGRARLIDFGLVYGSAEGRDMSPLGDLTRAPSGSAAAEDSTSVAPAKSGGRFVGTYRYAAPEQRRGEVVDAAADQYALCACIWESLCGQAPPVRPARTTLAKPLQTVLRRGLSETPADRYPSLAELLAALDAVVGGEARGPRRWLGAMGLVAVVVGVGTAGLLEPTEARADPCVRDAAALDGTWDEPRRTALRRRFDATGQAFGPTTLATVERGIDDWAARWQDAQREACVATRVLGTESEPMLAQRRECLEQRRRSLQVTLDTWEATDAALELPARAPALLERLPALWACADAPRLAEVEPLPEPGPARQAVLAGYDRLSEARALAAAGATAQARAVTAALEADAMALGYAPLRLEWQALPAQLDVERGGIFRAVPRLVELAREAEARHLDVLSAQLRVEAAVAAAGRWTGMQPEQFLVDEAETTLRRLARPREPLRAPLQHARAALLLQDGRFEDALAAFGEARALAVAQGDAALAERERWYIAATLGQLGRFEEARTSLEIGRTQAEQRWGPSAPLVGSLEFDLAVLALETGSFESTVAHLDRAEAIYGAAFGAESFMVARVRYARAKGRMAEGAFTEALGLVERALEVYLRELGPGHEKLAELYEARGVLRFFTDDVAGSVEAYRAALAIAHATVGPDHPSLARLHSNLGESEAALGRLDQAQESFARALEIYGRSLPPDHPELALPLKGRGQVALALGHAAQAVEDLERALALQQATGAEPLELADIRFSLARALVAAEGAKSERAKSLAARARTDFAGLELPERAQAVDAWLGS